MPVFLGVAWDRENNLENYRFDRVFSTLLRSKTTREITRVSSKLLLVYAALKEYDTTQERIVVFSNQKGVALGRFFNKFTNEPPPFKQVQNCSFGDGPKWISEHYWGRYVILFSDNNEFTIYRDPIGLGHVYFVHFQKGLFFSSDIHLLLDAVDNLQQALQLNWAYFASYLSYGILNTSDTPYNEIKELLPGCCLTYKNMTTSITQFWDPTKLKRSIVNAESLASVFNESVKQWIGCSSNVCLQLSGGLDSTALYFSMNQSKQNDQKFVFVNYFNSLVASSDESKYVKTIVGDSDVDLIFHEFHYEPTINKIDKWNRPNQAVLGINSRLALLEKLNFEQIDLVSGHGGDHLFLANFDPTFLADYFLHHKGLIGFLNKLKSASLLKRSPALPYLVAALKALFRYSCGKSIANNPFSVLQVKWFRPELEKLINFHIYYPPFWTELSKMEPGKALHILKTYHASAYTEFDAPGISEFFPYLSQPLVEYGLSYPTYESFDRNWSRIHFRRDISNHFKTNHVWRQSKGEVSGIIQLCINKNFKRVRELCLEGQFSQKNLVDRDALDQHISLIASGRVDQQSILVRLLSAELWFEAWAK